MFCKKCVLKNFGNWKKTHLWRNLFFNKVIVIRPFNFIKKETPTQVFFCEFCRIFKNTSEEQLQWLPLKIVSLFTWTLWGMYAPELGFPWLFWKLNLMNDICDLKCWNCNSVSIISEVSDVFLFIICPTIRNEFDINCTKLWTFFAVLHAINKVQLCYSIFSIKTSSKLVPSVDQLVWPFGNFFVTFLCLRLFKISSICSRDVIDPVKRKARFLFCDFLSLLFIDTLLSVLQCFSSSEFSTTLSSWSKPLRTFGSSSGWSFSPAFIALKVISILDLSDWVAHDLVHILLYILQKVATIQSTSLKLFYICNEAIWFWEQSNLSRKIPPMWCKYSLLPFWDKFETNILRICAHLSLTNSKLIPSYAFLTLKSVVLYIIWSSFFAKTRQSSHPARGHRGVSNEIPNDVSMERRQDASVVHLHEVTKKLRDNVSRRLKLVSNETPNDVSVVRHQDLSVVCLHDVAQERCSDTSEVPNCKVSSKFQMKRLLRLRWYVSTTSLNYVAMTPYKYVSTTFSSYIAMNSNW